MKRTHAERLTKAQKEGLDVSNESEPAATVERHEFEPYHPSWVMPRCKVCREFEDHRLHQPTATDTRS